MICYVMFVMFLASFREDAESARKPSPSCSDATHGRRHMRTTIQTKLAAAALIVAFVLMAIVNALATSGTLVTVTNTAVANTHPVYGLPSGYAFSVWGIIYTLEAVFCVCQALPSSLANDELAKIRLPVLGLFAANAGWLFLFGFEAFWAALIVIVVYDYFLFVVLTSLDVNMLSRRPAWVLKLAAAAFGANASWVTVASCLQVQVNLLEEGWLSSPDFAIGLLAGAVGVACAAVYRFADPVYAAVAAWALSGIIANQAPDSLFGCDAQICPACAEGLPICERASTSTFSGRPNGFAELCGAYNASATAAPRCVVDKSAAVVGWAYAGIGAVALALVIGVARGAALRAREATTELDEAKDPEAPRSPLSAPLATPGASPAF
jgi:hypothetical protein